MKKNFRYTVKTFDDCPEVVIRAYDGATEVGYLVMSTHNEVMEYLQDYSIDLYEAAMCSDNVLSGIEALHIEAAYRRQGVASAMMRMAIEHCDAVGVDRIYLEAFSKSDAMSHATLAEFYARFGFVARGKNGRGVMFMQRRKPRP